MWLAHGLDLKYPNGSLLRCCGVIRGGSRCPWVLRGLCGSSGALGQSLGQGIWVTVPFPFPSSAFSCLFRCQWRGRSPPDPLQPSATPRPCSQSLDVPTDRGVFILLLSMKKLGTRFGSCWVCGTRAPKHQRPFRVKVTSGRVRLQHPSPADGPGSGCRSGQGEEASLDLTQLVSPMGRVGWGTPAMCNTEQRSGLYEPGSGQTRVKPKSF